MGGVGTCVQPPGRGGGVGGGTGVSAPDPKLIPPTGDLVPGAWGAASPLQREQHPVSLGTQKTAITLQRGFLQTWDFSTVTSPWPRCAHGGSWAGKVSPTCQL